MKKFAFCAAFAALACAASAADLKLSLQAYTFRDRSVAETVETAVRLGYSNLELYPGQRLGGGMEGSTDYKQIKPESLAALKAFLAKNGVKAVSYGVTGAGSDDDWKKLMEFCKTLGIVQIQIEVGASRDTLARAEKFAKEYGVRVSLHNHRQDAGRPENVLKSLEGFGPLIGAGSDIGHWHNAGVNPVNAVKMLKGRFHTIHAIDSSAPKGGKDVALGSGCIDVKGVLDLLKANEEGTIYVTVEDEWQHADLEVAVAASARWFNAWQRGELAADGRVPDDKVAALWTDANDKQPSLWDMKLLETASSKVEEKVSQMTRANVEPASLASDQPGMNKKEGVASAFAGSNVKFCRPWNKGAYVSCRVNYLVAANYYTISSANDNPGRDPKAWTLYGSKDGKDWVELDRQTNQKFADRDELKGFAIKNPQMCRHYKLVFDANGGDKLIQFNRIGFFE